MIIYECHVKGLTAINPHVATEHRGTFLGVSDDWMIAHLKSLNVDAVQLMPVFDSHGTYWGYDPVSWFELNPKYGTLFQFMQMLGRLHDAGIKVILDVVYNHTHGKMPGVEYYDWDVTGCGNTVDVCKSLPTIMKSMRFWLRTIGVDGMRFDLANVLGREGGNFNPDAEFFTATKEFDDKILIAEPWDCAEYSLGRYPGHWLELNGAFRDCVRGGREYRGSHVQAHRSVNFITCHDGFTLEDFVSYNHKHNEANGECNRDGCDDNKSFNHGIEGPTDDAKVLASRKEHKAWLMRQLMQSKGHKLILSGDEVGNTQYGNNNAYNQDNDIGWVKW